MLVRNGNRKLMLIPVAIGTAMIGGSWTATASAGIVNGFTNSSNWTLNTNASGGYAFQPVISNTGDLTLTSAFNGEQTSAWFNTQQDVADSWTASFTWQMSGVASGGYPADGFMFAVQNGGLNALGAGGGGKGYQTAVPPSTGQVNVTPSVGLGFEVFTNDESEVNVGINGNFVTQANVPGSTLNIGDLNGVGSTAATGGPDMNPINFTISYYAPTGVLSVSAVDSTNSADSLSYIALDNSHQLLPPQPINVSSVIGQGNAYVGFTGGTGGFNMEQDFTNFNFSTNTGATAPPGYTAPPPAPAYILATRTPVALTSGSFNADNVVENAVSLTSGQTIPSSVASPVGSVNTFYEAGLSVGGTVQGGGLPTSHQFVSQADEVTTFQLQHYTNTNNVLHLSTASGGITSGTMTLATPAAFTTLSILATSTNAGSNVAGTVTLNFANGQTVTTDYAAPDWFSNSTGTTPDGNAFGTALSGIGRINTQNSSTSGLPNEPDLYETVLNLANLGTGSGTVDVSGDVLDSLTFNINPTTATTDIFAVSGSAVPEPAPLAILAAGAVGMMLIRRRKPRHAGKC